MLLLSKEDIKSVITMKDMIEADKQAFKMVVDGTVDTPLRTAAMGTGCRLRISSRIKVLVWIRRERVCYCFQKRILKV